MTDRPISAVDPYERSRIAVLDSEMAYIDVGQGDPIVFLHGNPTSAYLWRNIIPYLAGLGRCLAPDLIGMGQSGKNPSGSYRFIDHYRYLDAWFEMVGLTQNVTLVLHDWGSALGFQWAYKHRRQDSVKAVAYMEAIVRPISWSEWPEQSRSLFQAMRSAAGEEIILVKNVFIERLLPGGVIRPLSEAEMAVYRQPYLEVGEVRRPTLTWPRQIPIDGEPEDVVRIVDRYAKWLAPSPMPKLFINAEPGTILTGPMRRFCRTWNNQTEITVKGIHFIQEDSPHQIGEALAAFVKQI